MTTAKTTAVAKPPAAFINRGDEQTLAEIAERLAAPMPYRWRLKTVANKARKPYPEGTRGQFIGYINARDVMNRLDDVIGWANWRTHIRETTDGSLIVALELRIGEEWIGREDIGYPNNPGSELEEEPLKAAASDGLKRAAVHFGVGRFLYELPPVWTGIDASGSPLRPIEGAAAGARPAIAAGANIDPDTGEITEPAVTQETTPCAIEDCKGVCIGAWVDFSLRRYGVALCSRHSAMAKRGELEAELERLNHGGGAAPAPGSQAAPQDQTKSELDWTKCWPLMKAHGVKNATDFQRLTGVDIATVNPDQALDLVVQKAPGLKS